MRRINSLTAVLLILTALIPAAAVAQDEVTLVIWGEPGTADCINNPDDNADNAACIYAQFVNDTWSEANPGVALKWENQSWDEELRQNLTTAILGGTAPDITVGENFIPSLAQRGVLAKLDLPQEVKDNLVPGTVMGATVGEDLYGVAAFSGVFGLEVNADVLRAAGLDPDAVDLSTWESAAEVMAQVTEAGKGEYYGVTLLGSTGNPAATLFRAAPYIHQMNADFCNRDEGCTEPTLNDPLAVPVYEWFRTMYANADPNLTFHGDEGYIYSQLYTGASAMQTDGAWGIGRAEANNCNDCRYYPLPYPAEGRRANVVVGNAIYSVLDASDHVEEAQRFLEWLVSDPVQITSFWSTGRLPTTFSALQKVIEVANGDTSSVPEFYFEQLGHTKEEAIEFAKTYSGFLDELLNGEVYILPQWAVEGSEMNRLWDEMFTEILTSDRPIEEILDEYQAMGEEIMANAE
ncbi:MAG: carbohydrate ABC transporter substrate-binding protein [Anaerolineae bacterium]|nr:carbohydrate ABC transporter substrate-binding protein [Anaerolineae bacterium]